MKALTDGQVSLIRISGYTDSYWARRLRVTNPTIRDARQGVSYKNVTAAPDRVPREATGCTQAIRHGLPQAARQMRQRRSFFR